MLVDELEGRGGDPPAEGLDSVEKPEHQQDGRWSTIATRRVVSRHELGR